MLFRYLFHRLIEDSLKWHTQRFDVTEREFISCDDLADHALLQHPLEIHDKAVDTLCTRVDSFQLFGRISEARYELRYS